MLPFLAIMLWTEISQVQKYDECMFSLSFCDKSRKIHHIQAESFKKGTVVNTQGKVVNGFQNTVSKEK